MECYECPDCALCCKSVHLESLLICRRDLTFKASNPVSKVHLKCGTLYPALPVLRFTKNLLPCLVQHLCHWFCESTIKLLWSCEPPDSSALTLSFAGPLSGLGVLVWVRISPNSSKSHIVFNASASRGFGRSPLKISGELPLKSNHLFCQGFSSLGSMSLGAGAGCLKQIAFFVFNSCATSADIAVEAPVIERENGRVAWKYAELVSDVEALRAPPKNGLCVQRRLQGELTAGCFLRPRNSKRATGFFFASANVFPVFSAAVGHQSGIRWLRWGNLLTPSLQML